MQRTRSGRGHYFRTTQNAGGAGGGTAADNFTRADGAIGTASDGVAWSATDASWVITSNKAAWRNAGAGSPAGLLGTSNATRANAAGAQFSATIGFDAGGDKGGFILRYVDANNFHVLIINNDGRFSLFEVAAGAFDAGTLSAAGQYTVSSTGNTLVVTNNSSTGAITATVNGGTTMSVTYAGNKTVSTIGIYMNNPAGFFSDAFRFNSLSVAAV